MRDPAAFWERKRSSLERVWKIFRRGAPEGVREISTALERIEAAARAAGDGDLARRARRIGRRLSKLCALEGNRELLSRVRRLGFLPPEAASGLDARWEELSQGLTKRVLRKVRGRAMRKLRRALSRRARAGEDGLARRLERARRRSADRLSLLAGDAGDRDLSRYLRAARKARNLALAIAEAGGAPLPALAVREGPVGGALDRWNDLRVFRRRLRRERREAERRGAVLLALELDGLISVLDDTLDRTRREVREAARAASNVVAFQRRSA